MKHAPIKKRRSSRSAPEMRAEYDFSGGARGKYADRYRRGVNVILLDPELAAAFPDSKSVNDALRALLEIAGRAYIGTAPELRCLKVTLGDFLVPCWPEATSHCACDAHFRGLATSRPCGLPCRAFVSRSQEDLIRRVPLGFQIVEDTVSQAIDQRCAKDEDPTRSGYRHRD
jgi:hypothetical protein